VAGREGEERTADATRAIFVSYASQDAAIAATVVEALERSGVACWIAPRDVTPGAFYADAIVHAIDATKATVLILSRHAGDSQHVLREVERAASKRHPVVSLRIDQAPLPAGLEYFLNTSQWLDASGGDIARSIPTLIAAVGVVTRAPAVTPEAALTPRPPATSPSARSSKRTTIIVASLIGLGITGLAIDRLWVSSRSPALTSASIAPVSASAPAPPVPTVPEKSVAVLPFVDMSEKHDQEYFADGLSEELIDLLTKVPDLRVPARTSSFYFKGKQTRISDIARELAVAHVLEGSVRKSGNRLRITAQLIRADNGYHVWSETYDRTLDDIFKVQDGIAAAVVKALKVSLTDRPMATVKGTRNIEAYNLYLQARLIHLQESSQRDEDKAINYLREALRADATYAPAWAYLARLLSSQAEIERLGDGPITNEALHAAERALELDPELADAHTAAARIYMNNFLDLGRAGTEIRRALSFEPRNSFALAMLAEYDGSRGEINSAIELTLQSIDSDPANQRRYYDLARAYYVARRYDDAMLSARRWIGLNPAAEENYEVHGKILLANGDPGAALAAMDRETNDKKRLCLDERVLAYDGLGRKADAAAGLTYLEEHCADITPYGIGRIYADRGAVDQAFKWFDRAYHGRDTSLTDAKVDPLLENVQSDPRFTALLKKMGLAD